MTRMHGGSVATRLLALLLAVMGWAAPAAGQADTETRVWTMVSARGRWTRRRRGGGRPIRSSVPEMGLVRSTY